MTTFAYPYEIFDQASRRVVEQYYQGECSVRLDLARSNDDHYKLSRVDTYYLRSVPIFRLLGTPWLSVYLRLRQAGRGLHRKALSNKLPNRCLLRPLHLR